MFIKEVKERIRNVLNQMRTHSLRSAAREQGLGSLKMELSSIVPDITDQYSNFKVDSVFLTEKVRNLHAFQMSLVRQVIGDFESPVVADIGDSSGTHLEYIKGLFTKDRNMRCLSVNLDPDAVERIRRKGLHAICSRAEDLQNYNIEIDIFLCFETLEHLMNPCCFLHDLSSKTNAKILIITVPYLRESRVGLHHIRKEIKNSVNAENTHIFELSPEDWKLLLQHSGWKISHEKIYLQYPKYGLFRITQPLWKYFDFEGFYGLILKRDDTWSSKYLDW